MKISQSLHQFKNENALLVVFGGKIYIFYYAEDGMINKEADFNFESRSYSDREGFFLKSGHGRVFSSGMALKELKNYENKKLLKSFGIELKKMIKNKGINSLYIFAPRELMPSVVATLNKKESKILKRKFAGNFTKQSSFDIIKIIEKQAKQNRKKINNNIEAKKILAKSRKARKIIKGKP